MCSSGGQVAANDQSLQDANLKANSTFLADANTTFAEQQSVLRQQQVKLAYIAANPMGYTPQQLHTATTSINDNTSRAAKQALGSAAAFAAAHGGADIGGGSTGELAGQIGSAAAQSKSQQLANLSTSSEELKQQNMWKALGGLQQVGADYGSSTGTSIGGAGSTGSTVTNAGEGVTAAQQAGWQDFSGVLSGISGIAQAGATAYAKCWVAAAIYGGWDDPRTHLVRSYIFGEFSETWYGSLVSRLYVRVGERVSKHPWLVRCLKPLFDAALRKARKV